MVGLMGGGISGFGGRQIAFGNDARGLSKEEQDAIYIANLRAMQPAKMDAAYTRMMMNWTVSVPERPLDERFADFKTRLAAARAKYPHLR